MMKFLVVFAAFAAVAFAYPPTTTWTLQELSEALQNPSTDHILVPYLEAALNEMMAALMHGEQLTHITIAMPYVGTYNVNELAAAIQNPNTNPAHIPYLEDALNELMLAIHSGIDQEWITVVIPADLPVPDQVKPEVIAPVETPIVEAPAASSPLVQIIVNVQKQQQIVNPVEIEHIQDSEIIPTPVQVVEEAFVPDQGPIPVNPVDIISVMPVMPVKPELPGFGPMI